MHYMSVRGFSLGHTVESGQLFRWVRTDGFYYINSGERFFKVCQEGNRLLYDGDADSKFLTRFFRLDDDMGVIVKSISVDDNIKKAVKKYKGMRLMRMDPWECLISYICSANANIPNIRLMVNLLSESFGREVELDGQIFYTFPKRGAVNDLRRIRESKTGFRARYIKQANSIVSDDYFGKLRGMDYHDAKKELMELPGVGQKVADCVLLFSLDKLEAFPVDTWVRKVMKELYFGGRKVTDARIRSFASERFGEYAGYAQEYLFLWQRMSGKE